MDTQTPADNTDKKKTQQVSKKERKKEKISKHNVIKCHSGGSSHSSFRTAKKHRTRHYFSSIFPKDSFAVPLHSKEALRSLTDKRHLKFPPCHKCSRCLDIR